MTTATMPSADVVFDTLFAYQRSGALKTAIELEIFTHHRYRRENSCRDRCQMRGVRARHPHPVRFPHDDRTADEVGWNVWADALNRRHSSASSRVPISGTTMRFLLLPELKLNMDSLTDAVRRGGVAPSARQHRVRREPDLDRVRALDGTDDHAVGARDRRPRGRHGRSEGAGHRGRSRLLRHHHRAAQPACGDRRGRLAERSHRRDRSCAGRRSPGSTSHAAGRCLQGGVSRGLRRRARHQLPASLRSRQPARAF